MCNPWLLITLLVTTTWVPTTDAKKFNKFLTMTPVYKSQEHGRMIGGVEATAHDYPWIVQIRQSGHHICAGTILNQHFVLTSAHCVNLNQMLEYTVMAGDHNVRCPESVETLHRVVDIREHYEYEKSILWNDIAVMQVDPPFTFNRFIGAATLPTTEKQCEFAHVLAVGWGEFRYNSDEFPARLMKVTYPVLDYRKCNDAYGLKVFNRFTMECLGATGNGSCHGDSGGPVMYGPKKLICGVHSKSLQCDVKKPEIATRVPFYKTWIDLDSNPNKPPLPRVITSCGGFFKLPNATFYLRNYTQGNCYWIVDSLRGDKLVGVRGSTFTAEDEIWVTSLDKLVNKAKAERIQTRAGAFVKLTGGSSIFLLTVRMDPKNKEKRTLALQFLSTGMWANEYPVRRVLETKKNGSVITHPRPDSGHAYLNDDYFLGGMIAEDGNHLPRQGILTCFFMDIDNPGGDPKCPLDHLSIFLLEKDGTYNEVKRFCGQKTPSYFRFGGYALLKFQSTQDSNFGRGFVFHYEVKPLS